MNIPEWYKTKEQLTEYDKFYLNSYGWNDFIIVDGKKYYNTKR